MLPCVCTTFMALYVQRNLTNYYQNKEFLELDLELGSLWKCVQSPYIEFM